MDQDALREAITSLECRRQALLREMDGVDLELTVRKAQYSRIVNDNTPIYRLPNELLITIFIICLQIRQTSKFSSKANITIAPFQVMMSHVSHRWRDIVLSTPLLWNTINFRIRPTIRVRRGILSQLNAHLTRSDACFLDVTLDFHIVEGISSYLQLIALHSKRLRRLSIVTRCEQVQDILDLLRDTSTPTLEHLSLTLGKPQEQSSSPRKEYPNVLPSIILCAADSLKFVRLAGLALGQLHPPTSTVTTLHLDGWTRHYMTHDQFKNILEAACSLENLSLNQLCIRHPRDPLEILPPVNLLNLRSLRILGSSSPTSRPLSLMNMPHLRSLWIQNVDTFDSDVLPSVTSLSIDSCAFDATELKHLFRACPSVTFLSIDESLPDLYSMLLPGETVPKPWPYLETISLRDLLAADVPHFCNMVLNLKENRQALSKVYLDQRSRTVLKRKHRLDWLHGKLIVENCDETVPWPLGLGYDDTHDLLE